MRIPDITPRDRECAERCENAIRRYWLGQGYDSILVWREGIVLNSNIGRDGFPPGERKEMT